MAYRDAAARDAARIAAEVEVGAVEVLDRHTERPGRLGDGGQGLQNLQQGRPRVPFGRVVTAHAGDGDGERCRQTGGFCEGEVVGDDGVEGVLRLGHDVHLGHGQDDVAHAQQGDDMAVPPRLGQHALARVDQDQGGVGGRGAGGDVAPVLLMSRRIGADEQVARRREVAIGRVDGDALFALGQKAADPVSVAQGGDLIIGHGTDVMQQEADQDRLAVVHRAAGDEAQGVAFSIGPA